MPYLTLRSDIFARSFHIIYTLTPNPCEPSYCISRGGTIPESYMFPETRQLEGGRGQSKTVKQDRKNATEPMTGKRAISHLYLLGISQTKQSEVKETEWAVNISGRQVSSQQTTVSAYTGCCH